MSLEETAVVETDEAQPNSETRVEPAEPVVDRKELEAKTAERMAAAFGDETVDDEKPAAEAAATEKKEDAEEKPASDELEAADGPSTDTKDDASPTLPAAYVRSLKAKNWTDEEIEHWSKQPGFVTLASKIHDERNKEIQAWAELGRKTREVSQTPAATATPASSGGLKPVDVDALKKAYGEDGLIDQIAGPVNQMIDKINRLMPEIEKSQGVSKKAELETLGRQIEGFFGAKDLEPYKDVYGNLKTGLNETQIQSRNKLLETADAMIAGAKVQGRELSLDDALTMAHDAVSSGFKEQAVRTTIRKQLKTREKGISLRPGGVKKAPADGKVSTRRDLERKVSNGLAAVFGNR